MREKILKHNFLLYFKFCSKILTYSAVLGDMRCWTKEDLGVFLPKKLHAACMRIFIAAIVRHSSAVGLVALWTNLIPGLVDGEERREGMIFQLPGQRQKAGCAEISSLGCCLLMLCSPWELPVALYLRKGVQPHLAPLSSHGNTAWVCSWISCSHGILQLIGNVSVSTGIKHCCELVVSERKI